MLYFESNRTRMYQKCWNDFYLLRNESLFYLVLTSSLIFDIIFDNCLFLSKTEENKKEKKKLRKK